MTQSLTDMLERAAGPVPPAPDVSALVDVGRRRRRRTIATTVIATAATAAAVIAGAATVWTPLEPPGGPAILDQPALAFEPWEGQDIDVAIFLCDGPSRCPSITPAQRIDLAARLQAEAVVEAVYFESKQDAAQRLLEEHEAQPDLFGGTPLPDEDVLVDAVPASFRVKLTDPAAVTVIEDGYSDVPGVEAIRDQSRLADLSELSDTR